MIRIASSTKHKEILLQTVSQQEGTQHLETHHHFRDSKRRVAGARSCINARWFPNQVLRIGYRVSAWLVRNNFVGRNEEKDDGTRPGESAQAGNNFCRGMEIEIIEEIPPKDDIEACIVIVIEKPIIQTTGFLTVWRSVTI